MKKINFTSIAIFLYSTLLSFSFPSYSSQNIEVNNAIQLLNAISKANSDVTDEPVKIILNNGIYTLKSRIVVTRPNLTFKSKKNNPHDVIIKGLGMKPSNNVEVLFDISADNITISGITISQTSNHLIQVRSEKKVKNFILRNCILRDAYQQLLKISSNGQDSFSEYGIVEDTLFEYTNDTGPNFYIGGIDAHHAKHWIVRRNTFKNIASPSERAAEYAIHFWKKSESIEILDNLIINSDRGIGLGLGNDNQPVKCGLISNNVIVNNSSSHLFSDVGISIENAQNITIDSNSITLSSYYPNAIEFRFPSTQNIIVKNNIANRAIVSRDGARGTLINNKSISIANQFYFNAAYMIQRLINSF